MNVSLCKKICVVGVVFCVIMLGLFAVDGYVDSPKAAAVAHWKALFENDGKRFANSYVLPESIVDLHDEFVEGMTQKINTEMPFREASLRIRGQLQNIEVLNEIQADNHAIVHLRFIFGNGEVDESITSLVRIDTDWKVPVPISLAKEILDTRGMDTLRCKGFKEYSS